MWRSRNREVLERADKILADEFASERSQLEDEARLKADQLLAPVMTADTARRIKWCDSTADELASMELWRARGVDALMDYQPR